MTPNHFQIVGERACAQAVGFVSLNEAVNMVGDALAFARQQRVRKILVDITALRGFPPPTILQRYRFCQKWANAAGPALRVAMVARSEMIDPGKFGVTVMRNRGTVADVFVSEAEAASWLDSVM
jgi:hypothetical protein